MDAAFQNFSQRSAFLARNWLAVALVLSLLANIILAMLALNKTTAIVMLPAESADREYRIEGSKVSKAYLSDMATTAAAFLLNQTPGATEVARERFLRLLHPGSYGSFSTRWDRTVEDLQRRDISTVFYPLVLRVNQEALIVEIEGQFVTFLGGSREEEPRTYLLQFTTNTGPLLLTSFTEVTESEND